MKKRVAYLDVIRIVACFLVIANHTNSIVFKAVSPSPTWFASLSYFYLSKVAVPLFLMVSGIVLLKKEDSYKKTAVRVGRILMVLVPFSLFYYIVQINAKGDKFSLTQYLLNLYHGKVSTAYWYLFLYLGILLMLPLLQRLNTVMKKNDYIYFFIISFGIVGTVPMLTVFNKNFSYSSSFNLSLFCTYIGMLFAGYYIENYMKITKAVAASSFFILVATTAFNVLATYKIYMDRGGKGKYWILDDRENINIILPSLCAFILIKYLCTNIDKHPKIEKMCCAVGACTFGTYLISDFLITKYKFVFTALKGEVHVLVAIILYELIVFATGLVLTWVVRRIPFMRKLL